MLLFVCHAGTRAVSVVFIDFLVNGAAVEHKALSAVVMLQSECASGASAVVTLSSEGAYVYVVAMVAAVSRGLLDFTRTSPDVGRTGL